MATSKGTSRSNGDERLPLRWAVIFGVAVGAGFIAGFLGGPLAGFGAGLAVCGLLFRILGR